MAILPSSNLKKNEVRDILNANGGVVGNKMSSLFKASANINKWAKYKPESYDTMFGLIENDRYRNNYGFNVKELGGNIEKVFSDALNGWEYILPSGSEDSPFRIGDFRGYNPDAMPPFDFHNIGTSGETTTTSYTASWKVIIPSGNEIKMSDLSVFDDASADYYQFIARKKTGMVYVYAKSSVVAKSTSSDEMIFSITFPSEGTWECVFCLGKNLSEEIESRTDLIPLPDGHFEFIVTKKAVFIRVEYTYSPEITYDSSSKTLKFGYIYLTMEAYDTAVSVPSTYMTFGYYIELLDSNEFSMGGVEVYSEEESEEGHYQGTGTVNWNLINFPSAGSSSIALTDHFNDADLANAYKVRLRTVIEVNNTGGGSPVVPTETFDFIL